MQMANAMRANGKTACRTAMAFSCAPTAAGWKANSWTASSTAARAFRPTAMLAPAILHSIERTADEKFEDGNFPPGAGGDDRPGLGCRFVQSRFGRRAQDRGDPAGVDGGGVHLRRRRHL